MSGIFDNIGFDDRSQNDNGVICLKQKSKCLEMTLYSIIFRGFNKKIKCEISIERVFWKIMSEIY